MRHGHPAVTWHGHPAVTFFIMYTLYHHDILSMPLCIHSYSYKKALPSEQASLTTSAVHRHGQMPLSKRFTSCHSQHSGQSFIHIDTLQRRHLSIHGLLKICYHPEVSQEKGCCNQHPCLIHRTNIHLVVSVHHQLHDHLSIRYHH